MARRTFAEGEPFRLVGGVKLTRRSSERMIARDGDWILIEVAEWSKGGWTSCQLYLDRKAKKNMWQVGVKNGRSAKNRSVKLLEEHHPDRLQWVLDVLSKDAEERAAPVKST